jgi:hypothetical protein
MVAGTIVDQRPARSGPGGKRVSQLLIASNRLCQALVYGNGTGLDPRARVQSVSGDTTRSRLPPSLTSPSANAECE